jgi:hypothetical protein
VPGTVLYPYLPLQPIDMIVLETDCHKECILLGSSYLFACSLVHWFGPMLSDKTHLPVSDNNARPTTLAAPSMLVGRSCHSQCGKDHLHRT